MSLSPMEVSIMEEEESIVTPIECLVKIGV
jgi:hypothetical protein